MGSVRASNSHLDGYHEQHYLVFSFIVSQMYQMTISSFRYFSAEVSAMNRHAGFTRLLRSDIMVIWPASRSNKAVKCSRVTDTMLLKRLIELR